MHHVNVGGDPDVFILSDWDSAGSVEVSVFQVHADVVIRKSVREGFGLTVTEASWKGRPTIGGAVGGIPLQIDDGVTGTSCHRPPGARSGVWTCSPTPRSTGARPSPARSTCAASSSRRACSATTCDSSATCGRVR